MERVPGALQLQGRSPLCQPSRSHVLCPRLREALGECGKEHQKDRARPKHYISYLLAVLNNNMALR